MANQWKLWKLASTPLLITSIEHRVSRLRYANYVVNHPVEFSEATIQEALMILYKHRLKKKLRQRKHNY